MIDKLLGVIWKTGRLVCPVCYRRLGNSTSIIDDWRWDCHHCELETYDPAYSWYWPFDVILPRFSYWIYMKQTNQEDYDG